MSRPIVTAALADVELAPSPIDPDWITDGAPIAQSKRLAVSADRSSAVFAWSCTAGRFTWHYAEDETILIMAGEAFITDHRGEERRLRPGEMAFFPAGSKSHWYVPREVKKLAVCNRPVPGPLALVSRVYNKVAHLLDQAAAAARRLRRGSAQALRGVIDKSAAAPLSNRGNVRV